MFDLNAIVSAALNAAVQDRITEVLQQHANTVGALAERITALEGICATQHEGMVAMRDRIAVLENNPAQGVDTSVVAGNYTPVSNEQFKALLQEWATTGGFTIPIDEARMVEALNSQEWFWEKMQNRIDAATEQAVDDHCSTYDHDDYDSAVSKVDDLPDLDDYVTRDEVRSEIEDVLNNATLSLSI